ncbi:hypothetical protein F5876DRAFT_83745 [Lentinula aff. lateritia]|uniref:Uncharacterized protein n=1 Tax=Lentinula aff. lateritia TaxID=2804960 RepID=A0ACC1THC6_9AGAR|nr:hypothetical protein F5876DRAFT_83745 [Lentinula aff. lateritia]
MSLHIPPAHSIDDALNILPTLDSDATITISHSDRRHVLPRRITEEDLGLSVYREGDEERKADADALDSDEESDGSAYSDAEDIYFNDLRVVENPWFSSGTKKSKYDDTHLDPDSNIGSTSKSSLHPPNSPVKNPVNPNPNMNHTLIPVSNSNSFALGSASAGGFLGSLRGLFARNAKGGKDRKKAIGGIFHDEGDKEEDGSVVSSPPFFPSSSSTPAMPTAYSIRGRTMSEAHTPSTHSTNSTSTIIRMPTFVLGRRRLTPGMGRNSRNHRVLDRALVFEDVLPPTIRSVSVDYGELSVRSRNAPRPRSRAEEWVEGQGQHEQHQGEASAMETKEEENSVLTKKTSVKRRKSDKRRSLPVSSATSSSPPSSSSPLPSKPPRAPPTGDTPKKSMSVSVSRTSSIRSAASAPTGSSMTTSTKQTTKQATNTKPDWRASAPPVGGSTNGHGRPAELSGDISLMSIVEDVAKANREGWGKVEKEKENLGAGPGLGKKKPTSIALEDVRAPRGIDIEDLKEQMERESAEKVEKRGRNSEGYFEVQATLW